MAPRYYGLMSSLPWLPHPERAVRLPINRERLRRRLLFLDPPHARELATVRRVFEVRQERLTDLSVAAGWQHALGSLTSDAVREYLRGYVDRRCVLAALRRRHRGDLPPDLATLGPAASARWVRDHWDAPGFRREAVYPWVTTVQHLLEDGNAVEVERVLMRDEWTRLSRLGESHPFAFEEVVAYVLRWDLLRRWRTKDPAAARARFSHLIEEVIGDQRLIG